jgi:HD-like signal output (HDOD) protein
MSLTLTEPPAVAEVIARELDQARQRGPLRQIVIPPCPKLLTQLRDALDQPEPDLTEVARIAGSDVAMSATLIRHANGARFGTGAAVTTIGQALNRLGLDESAQRMTQFLVQKAMPVSSPHLQRFWEHAARSALAMSQLAQRLPGVSPDLAHTYGLFHHVGLPVLLQSVRGYGGTLVEARARKDRPFVATENANHKTDHAVVGALVARVWGLAPAVMAAIRLHHDLASLGHRHTDAEAHTLIALGLVAEALVCRHEGLTPDAETVNHQADALAWLQVGTDDLAAWEEDLGPLLDEV